MNNDKAEQLAKAMGYFLGTLVGISIRISLLVLGVYASLLVLEWLGFISTGVLL